ncbi:hypothetical protein TARUN_5234 [Trichoderma arundinaceum]|uniref:Zn(2)-C6 fungal-type domain-containing protein n=1 Tax=Trichoderma arundinaceum TaxID=490622 RepID=A0A395NMC0_TRIAR|nr:hypothetical protein TARUN_5234 [Trichoderma arundinaceum]
MAFDLPSPESAERSTLPRADNVCLSCRRKKKKCDKALPKCLHCKRLHLQCDYEDVESVPVIEEFRQLRKRLKLFEEMLIPGTSKAARPALLVADLPPAKHSIQPCATDYEANLVSRLETLASTDDGFQQNKAPGLCNSLAEHCVIPSVSHKWHSTGAITNKLPRSTLLQDATFSKPFANNHESMPKHLPFEAFDLDPSFSAIGDAIITRDAAPGVFGYQAEAWRLFDRTIAFRHRLATSKILGDLGDEKFQLDGELQHLMGTLVELSGGNTCGYCEPSAIVLVSLLILHSRHTSLTPDALRKGEVGGFPVNCVVASSLAVKTTVRMIVDVAYTINNHYRRVNIISFPPTYSHVIYRATLELISFHNEMDKAEWAEALETLREATWNYGRRWQAAGVYTLMHSYRIT